jgi:hypothetical protein
MLNGDFGTSPFYWQPSAGNRARLFMSGFNTRRPKNSASTIYFSGLAIVLAEARCSVVKDFADRGCCVVVHVLIREIIPKIKHTITKRRMVFTPRPARLSLKFMILPPNLGEDAIFLDCCPSTQSGGR